MNTILPTYDWLSSHHDDRALSNLLLSSIYLSFEIKVALFRVLSLSVSELVDGQKWKEKEYNRLCEV